MGTFLKKHVKKRAIKLPVAVLVCALLVVGGGIIAYKAVAVDNAVITPASGGSNVSIDTTSASGGTGEYTLLSGPAITETVPGDITEGVHTINLPSGWEFDTDSTITVLRTAGDIEPISQVITPETDSFTFTITIASTENSALAFVLNSMKVRPTGVTPSTDNMTYSGAGIVGVDGSTNFGTLTTVAGEVTQVAFTTHPGSAVYGSDLSPQPIVKTQDQFGNDSISGLGSNNNVVLTLTGTGALQGTATLDIGTSAGNGIVTFDGLTVNQFGAEKVLTASADNLTSAVSDNFKITKKSLTATITADSKTYDGNNSATFSNPVLSGVEFSDALTLSGGSATFADADASMNKVVTATGLTLNGEKIGNYNYDGTATGNADINKLAIAIIPVASQTKIYGENDPTFSYTFSPALIGSDGFTDALSRNGGEDVGTYAYTLGNLSAGGNYALTLDSATFEITKRPLTVTATGINRVYDATENATVTLSDNRVSGDNLTFGYTASFSDGKNVGNDKPVSVTAISITGGTDAGNYSLSNTTTGTMANIAPISLTASFTTHVNKTYDGDNSADITGRSLAGVISGETVGITGGSATFADKHIGDSKTVTAIGFTLTEVDAGNYTIGTINTTTGNVNTRPITVTAKTDSKTYDGGISSDETPDITNTGNLSTGPIMGTDIANFTQIYDNKNAGTGKTLTPSGVVNDSNSGSNYNYTFVANTTGVIIAKPVNVTAQTATKFYDGGNTSAVLPVGDILEGTDSWTNIGTQIFNQTNIGTGLTLTASGASITDGNGGANYVISYATNTTGEITKKELTVTGSTVTSKVYDGGTDATITGAILEGVINNEDVSLGDNTSGTFNTKDVGPSKAVTTVMTITGNDIGNYALTQPTITGAITKRPLTVIAVGENKVYDATDGATVTFSDDRISGDILTVAYAMATFVNKNVGNGKTVNVSGIAISGNDAGNYANNTSAVTSADITQATLTATVTVADKVCNGDNFATITGVVLGIIGSDTVLANYSGATATFIDATVGNGKSVSAIGITISSTDAGNYSYNGEATGTGNILPIPIVVFVDDGFTTGSAGGHTFDYDAFDTIHEAISAVDVGGTINVATGIYNENLVVDRKLTIQSSGATADTIINAADNQVYVVKITVNGVTLDGFTITGFSATNTILPNNAAIITQGVDDCTITNNILTGNHEVAISLFGGVGGAYSDSNTVSNNVINAPNGHETYGIKIKGSHNTISGNEIYNADTSIHVWSWDASETVSPDYNIISGNTIAQGAGNADHKYGIEIKTGQHNEVSGNIISVTRAGIHLYTSDRMAAETDFDPRPANNTISDNTITGGEVGIILLEGANTNTISGNTISETTIAGILGSLSRWPGDWSNSPSSHLVGTPQQYLQIIGNTFKDNTLDNCGHGIAMEYADNNIIGQSGHGNTIENNANTAAINYHDVAFTADYAGIYFDANSEGNTVNYNNIVDNTGGLKNANTATILDAEKNWWGNNSGPIHADNPFGTGDKASNNVDYRSWCTNQLCDPIDDTPPTAALSSTPADPTNQTTTNITVGGPDVVYYKYKLDGGGYEDETAVVNHIELLGLSESTHTIEVIGRDQAGNWQSEGSPTTYTWTVDITPPTAPTISATDPINITNPTMAITGTGEANTTVNYSVKDKDALEITGESGVNESGNINTDINVSTLADGELTVSVTLTDAADNISDAVANTVNKDMVAPTVEITSPLANAEVDGNAVITFTNDDSNAILACSINNSDWIACIDNTTKLSNITGFSGLDQGAFTLYLIGTDTAGNVGNNNISLIKDTVAPIVVLLSPSSNSSLTGGSQYDITWTGNAVDTNTDTVKIEYSYNSKVDWDVIADNVALVGDLNSYTWDVPSTNSDKYYVRITAVDPAGNSTNSQNSSAFSVTNDNTSPTVTLNSPNGGENWQMGSSYAITWSASDDNFGDNPIKLEYSIDNGANWNSIIDSTDNNGIYSWAIPSGVSCDNSCFVRATAIDGSNNSNSDTSNQAFTITEEPAMICTDLGNDQWTCDIALGEGWNLISSPVVVSGNIGDVLAGINDNINVVQYYNFTEWLAYNPNITTNDLTTIEDGKGYWIYMNDPDTLTLTGLANPAVVEGSLIPSTYGVNDDWNLIGFRSVKNMNAKEYVEHYITGAFGKDYIMWKYENGTSLEPLYLSDDMNSGYGYWLFME
ncbi:right-handed parallel beta-helix repeat-containing protein [Candidatus Parcubacteria bacterium]|nr:right-handed parallel beta-helix repeat-containing protein [Candidatus Parcubacteria bacterium]